MQSSMKCLDEWCLSFQLSKIIRTTDNENKEKLTTHPAFFRYRSFFFSSSDMCAFSFWSTNQKDTCIRLVIRRHQQPINLMSGETRKALSSAYLTQKISKNNSHRFSKHRDPKTEDGRRKTGRDHIKNRRFDAIIPLSFCTLRCHRVIRPSEPDGSRLWPRPSFSVFPTQYLL